METASPKRSVSRQLKDIISQAEYLRNSPNFEVDAENFSKFNNELKAYLIQHYDDPMVAERVQQIPYINYKSVQHKLWYWIVFPVELVYLWQKGVAKSKCLRDVNEAKNLYSSIQFLLKNE